MENTCFLCFYMSLYPLFERLPGFLERCLRGRWQEYLLKISCKKLCILQSSNVACWKIPILWMMSPFKSPFSHYSLHERYLVRGFSNGFPGIFQWFPKDFPAKRLSSVPRHGSSSRSVPWPHVMKLVEPVIPSVAF